MVGHREDVYLTQLYALGAHGFSTAHPDAIQKMEERPMRRTRWKRGMTS
jgi:hypothetical protein